MDDDISPAGYRSPLSLTMNSPYQEAEERQKSETLTQLPLLKEVVRRLNKRISDSDSVKQVLIVAKKYEIEREVALVVMDIVRQQLEVERGFIQMRVDKTMK